MNLSKFGRAIKRVDGAIKDAEGYLGISGKDGPSALAAHLAYQSAADRMAGIMPKDQKEKTAYEQRVRRLNQLAAMIVATGTATARVWTLDAQGYMDSAADSARLAAGEIKNPAVDKKWWKDYFSRRTRSDYELADRFLDRAEDELEAMGDLARQAKSVELGLEVGRQQDRVASLRKELENKRVSTSKPTKVS
ncbi:MAG: hypothetical protein HYS53_00875 [Candidatus Aenigmarchaeota archaeon]|nr:hypothetical protein [Candidatus Aenigmarchaeota archaeon]